MLETQIVDFEPDVKPMPAPRPMSRALRRPENIQQDMDGMSGSAEMSDMAAEAPAVTAAPEPQVVAETEAALTTARFCRSR